MFEVLFIPPSAGLAQRKIIHDAETRGGVVTSADLNNEKRVLDRVRGFVARYWVPRISLGTA